MAILENLRWRFRCPRSIDAIAGHFIANHIPKDQIGKLNFESAYIEWVDPWFAYRRRIGSIYGATICYKPRDDGAPRRGWNHHLWRKHETLDPNDLVERIFDVVVERLKRIAAEAREKPKRLDGGGDSYPTDRPERSA